MSVDKKNYKIEILDSEILREYDIRGIVGKNLKENTAYTIGRTFGSIVYANKKEKKIVVGYDGRLTSKLLHDALCQGLIESGLEVFSIGLCPTPMLYFAIYNLSLNSGIMVTGSHNPSEYNGFKMVLNKEPFYSTQIQELQKIAKKGQLKTKIGKLKNIDILSKYINRILTNIKLNKELKIAWDPGNGAVGVTIKKVIKNLNNCQHYLINEKVDGNFPNHHPDPTVLENLKQIQELVKKNNCDVGLAFDGDGDRLGIIDNKGGTIWADQYMIILAEEISKIYPGAPIIMDVKSSKVFFEQIKRIGCKPVMSKTGHSVIKHKMKEINSPLSGEMSGHVMYKDDFFGFDDAMYVALRFLRILSHNKLSLNKIISQYPKTYSTPETRFDVSEERKFAIVEEIKKRLLYSNVKVISIDGVRVESKKGWWGIRASNTQNALTVRAEALDKDSLKEMIKKIENELKLSGVNFKFSFE